jgi:hypothetical protein
LQAEKETVISASIVARANVRLMKDRIIPRSSSLYFIVSA